MSRGKWNVIAAALLLTPVASSAQNYRSGPIKMLVGCPPGGTADSIARDLGDKLANQGVVPIASPASRVHGVHERR
jgi:tripartite-type tricarboxylate transporter receptor subunit TctC